MHADVPMEEALLLVGLLNTAKVIGVFEEQNAPILIGHELQELEH